MKRYVHLMIKSLTVLISIVVVAAISLFYMGAEGIPFVEGDRVTTQGEAAGFRIGMSKEQAFDTLRTHYSRRNAHIRYIWRRDSSLASRLSPFETPQSRRSTSDPYGEYEVAVDALATLPLPLLVGERWDVELPASWVNDVYVTFAGNRVVKIQHSRWLFERP